MVPFGGFEMPVRYGSIIEEHEYVRKGVGIFDVSHMGEFRVSGSGSAAFLDRLLTRKIGDHPPGKVLYSLMCNEEGGTVDDVLLYVLSESEFLMIVNAANIEKDRQWILGRLEQRDVTFTDESETWSLLAVQGPAAEKILERTGISCSGLKYYRFGKYASPVGEIMVSRTGYTGSDGFEIMVENSKALELLTTILASGDENAGLCGLGCRDLCRIEAGFPLYGHELSDTMDPRISPSARVIDMDKEDFCGKNFFLNNPPPPLRCVGIRISGRQVPREGCQIFCSDKNIGEVTSGIFSPLLNSGIGIGYVDSDTKSAGIQVEIRDRRVEAEFVPLPFYSKPRLSPKKA